METIAPQASTTVRSSCRLCYNNCGVLIRIENGRPAAVVGDPQNPMNRGRLCQKGYASLEYLYHPDRLTHPLRRKGPRGADRWETISWPEALDTVARRLRHIIDTHGPEAFVFLRGASKGLADDLSARFVNLIGTPNIASPAPYCFMPMVNASRLTYGFYAYPDFDYPPACILVWGTNLEATHFMDFEAVVAARKRGAHLIVVDPVENELSRMADIWLRPRPGTDLLLALGMMRVIVDEGLWDREFVDTWTAGFAELAEHLRDYPLERVEALTWVPAHAIRQASVAYATRRPGCIPWGNGIETTFNGFQAARAIAILRAVCGNLGVPGGDVCCAAPAGILRGDPEFTCQDRMPAGVRDRRLSKGDGLIPLAFYSLPQTVVRAILSGEPYPVHAAYVQGGNPLTHYPNARQTREALERLDFLVVADLFKTPSALLADIVLPVASYLEFDSVEQPWTYPIASVQQKVAQVGECRSDGWILNELTRRMGCEADAWKDMVEPLERILAPSGIRFEELRQIGCVVGEKRYRHYEHNGFDTPSGKVELASSRLAEWGFDSLPGYHEPPETPFSEPERADAYPLVLTSRKAAMYRHSGGRQIESLRRLQPEPLVTLHRSTAGGLGIADGDWVCIATRRGEIRQRARLVDWIDPRVVDVDYGWWFPEVDASTLCDWDTSNLNILLDNGPDFNPEMGSPSMRGVFCCICKEEA